MEIVNSIVTLIGIPAVVVSLIYIGRKIQVLDDMQKTIEKIKNNVKVMSDSLIQSELSDFDGGRLQAYSPIQVTDEGQQYLEEVGFIEIFMEHEDDFFEFIEDEEPETDYDIENAAIKSVLFLFDEPYFKSVKEYLYNNPKEDRKEFIQIAGIYVRNKYMEHAGNTSE